MAAAAALPLPSQSPAPQRRQLKGIREPRWKTKSRGGCRTQGLQTTQAFRNWCKHLELQPRTAAVTPATPGEQVLGMLLGQESINQHSGLLPGAAGGQSGPSGSTTLLQGASLQCPEQARDMIPYLPQQHQCLQSLVVA